MRTGVLVYGDDPPDRLLELAGLAEDLGYDCFWHADEKFHRDPFVGLSLLAANTRRLQLGVCVTEPYARHPALIAMAIASLAELAPGRMVLGLGAGGSGFPAMGVVREHPSTALREAVGIIRALLAGETADHDGEVISFHNGRLNFDPPGQVPIVFGTRGRLLLRLAGEVADGVMMAPYASARGLHWALGSVDEGIRRTGRRPDEVERIARVDLCVSSDGASARRAVKPGIVLPLWTSYPRFDFLEALELPPVPEPLLEVLARRAYGLIAPNAYLAPDEYVRHLAVAGTLEEVTDQMVEIAGTGVDQITIKPVAPPGGSVDDVLRVFAGEVMSAVRESMSATGRSSHVAG